MPAVKKKAPPREVQVEVETKGLGGTPHSPDLEERILKGIAGGHFTLLERKPLKKRKRMQVPGVSLTESSLK